MQIATNRLKKVLLDMPRRDRAKAQGMQWMFTVNGYPVYRVTRRYWSAAGNKAKLDKAEDILSIAAF